MANPSKSTVTLPNDRDVVVVRKFEAPRALVFDAWTKPELVSRWLLGPPPGRVIKRTTEGPAAPN